jgi:hypothetical protein
MEQNETDYSDYAAGRSDSRLAALPYLVASPNLAESAGPCALSRRARNSIWRSTR